MEFIVMVTTTKDGKTRNDFHGFDDAAGATAYASYKAEQLRKKGMEFEIGIYEKVT